MTSPFPPPSGTGLTPLPHIANANAQSPSTSPMNIDIPSPLTALLPQIASTTSGLALTPGSNPFLALGGNVGVAGASGVAGAGGGAGGNSGASPFPLPYPLPPAASVRSTTSRGVNDIGLDECLRALEEAGRMVDRALQVRSDLDMIRANVFNQVDSRAENLQVEYNQLLTSLYLLSSNSIFGALPLPLPPAAETTTADLTAWCETRAALEFSRREGVRAGGKVVLDVLKLGR